MPDRSVKELFDEITALNRIELKILLEWFESKLGVPAQRSVRPPAIPDDRVFVSGYDITITGYTSPEKVLAIKKLREAWGFTINEAVAFLDSLPKTIYELRPIDDAFEIREKYMEAGLTVKMKWRSGYISYHEYSQFDKYRRNLLTNTPQQPDL